MTTTTLSRTLAELGRRVAEHGAAAEASALDVLAIAVRGDSPGAAAALADPDAADVVRARALAVASRVVLTALDPVRAEALAARLVAPDRSAPPRRRILVV